MTSTLLTVLEKESEYWDVVVTVADTLGSGLVCYLVDLGWYALTAAVFRDRLAGQVALMILKIILNRLVGWQWPGEPDRLGRDRPPGGLS